MSLRTKLSIEQTLIDKIVEWCNHVQKITLNKPNVYTTRTNATKPYH